jgi:hypothetical protein
MEGLKDKTDSPGPQCGPARRNPRFRAVKQHAPLGWAIQPAGQVEQSGFAAPAGAGDGQIIPALDGESVRPRKATTCPRG